MPEMTSEQGTVQKRKSNILLGICAVVIIALVVVIVVLVSGMNKKTTKRNVVVTQDNAEAVVESMVQQEYVEPGYYCASMSTTWHFTSGDAISEDAYVENVSTNTNDVYFDVFLRDNEEEAILESPVIPRGGELTNIALDKELPTGTHDCVMVYHLIDEEQNTISTLRVAFTIIVEQ